MYSCIFSVSLIIPIVFEVYFAYFSFLQNFHRTNVDIWLKKMFKAILWVTFVVISTLSEISMSDIYSWMKFILNATILLWILILDALNIPPYRITIGIMDTGNAILINRMSFIDILDICFEYIFDVSEC